MQLVNMHLRNTHLRNSGLGTRKYGTRKYRTQDIQLGNVQLGNMRLRNLGLGNKQLGNGSAVPKFKNGTSSILKLDKHIIKLATLTYDFDLLAYLLLSEVNMRRGLG